MGELFSHSPVSLVKERRKEESLLENKESFSCAKYQLEVHLPTDLE